MWHLWLLKLGNDFGNSTWETFFFCQTQNGRDILNVYKYEDIGSVPQVTPKKKKTEEVYHMGLVWR